VAAVGAAIVVFSVGIYLLFRHPAEKESQNNQTNRKKANDSPDRKHNTEMSASWPL
jgi:hypothetical protein